MSPAAPGRLARRRLAPALGSGLPGRRLLLSCGWGSRGRVFRPRQDPCATVANWLWPVAESWHRWRRRLSRRSWRGRAIRLALA